MEQKDPYTNLKEICDAACHDRKACAKGYKQMLESGSTGEMMQTWVDNWDDVVNSKYADIICKELPVIYPDLRTDMNEAGVYLNECPEKAQQYVKVIITATDEPVHIYDKARAYVLGKSKVIAHDNSQVYNNKVNDAEITLLDYAYGCIKAGKVTASGRSSLTCCCDATIEGAVQCCATGGTVHVKAYRGIEAFQDAVVYSHMTENITLHDNAQIKEPENE